MRKLIFYSIILFGLQACIKEDQTIDSIIKYGDKVPFFTLKSDNGDTFSSDELRSCVSVIFFFNTNCSDCKRELPNAEKFYQSVKQTSSFNFIAVAREQEAKEVNAYFIQNDLSIPFFPDPNRQVYSLFAQSIIPRLYLIDTSGTVIWIQAENINWETIYTQINKLLITSSRTLTQNP